MFFCDLDWNFETLFSSMVSSPDSQHEREEDYMYMYKIIVYIRDTIFAQASLLQR